MKVSEHIGDHALLWARICDGDRDAFSLFAKRNYASLYHYGMKFSTDKDLIRDCLQDPFLDLWEKRSEISDISAIRPYIFRALRNNLIRAVRKHTIFADLAFIGEDNEASVSAETQFILSETDEEVALKLRRAVEALPPKQREALYLRYYENLSYEEIGRIMNLQRQVVANYLQHGIRKLRDHWHHVALLALLTISLSRSLPF